MVRTLHFHCRGHGFDPWLGNYDPASYVAQPKKKRKRKRNDAAQEFKGGRYLFSGVGGVVSII